MSGGRPFASFCISTLLFVTILSAHSFHVEAETIDQNNTSWTVSNNEHSSTSGIGAAIDNQSSQAWFKAQSCHTWDSEDCNSGAYFTVDYLLYFSTGSSSSINFSFTFQTYPEEDQGINWGDPENLDYFLKIVHADGESIVYHETQTTGEDNWITINAGPFIVNPNGTISVIFHMEHTSTNSVLDTTYWDIEDVYAEAAQINNDDDGDGVADNVDQCTNTPSGENVDSNGCSSSQTDSDGDGTNDEIDFMPQDATQQHDTDGDGYGDNPNGTDGDDCPNNFGTSSGELVGCPDLDDDGIADEMDVCPGFDDAIDVDADGVSDGCDSLIDSDGDGGGDGTTDDSTTTDDSISTASTIPSVAVLAVGGAIIVAVLIVLILGVMLFRGGKDEKLGRGYGTTSIITNKQLNTKPISRANLIPPPNPQPVPVQPQVDMNSVVTELDQQRANAEMEAQRLRQQLASQSVSASQMAAVQEELTNLQQTVADSEQVKQQMEQEMEEMRKRGDSSFLMQDSVVAGDALIGSTKIESQTINDPEAIARAAIEAYRMAKSEDKD